jgi:hypothetical protein
MSKYDLLQNIIEKSKVLTNFYTNMSDEHLDELYDIIKEEIKNLDLEDIALERLNENNIVEYWNFVYKYDFYDKAEIKSKIYKYVRDNKVTLDMDDNLISNQVLLHNTCINQTVVPKDSCTSSLPISG